MAKPGKPLIRIEDLSLAILAWARRAGLGATVWIPAFAGMTGEYVGIIGE